MKIEPRYSPHSQDGYVGSNDISTTRHLATVAHRAPVPVDRLERMLKVLRNPPNVMGEHTPLPACACLDHACRVHLFVPRHLLVGLGVYRLSIFDAALLHLSIQSGTVEAHIRARWLFDGAVMEMVAGYRALAPSQAMTQSVRNCTFLCKMPSHCTILALA